MRKTIFLSCTILSLIGLSGCNFEARDFQDQFMSATEQGEVIMDTESLIPVETFYSDYFPCSDCHSEIEPNPQRRELVEMHDDIVFDHDSENRWCLACHSIYERDSLVLAGGTLLGFDESYKLCGQCHGPKYRDWRLGIHGKRTGEWNGEKQYRLCVSCHDPHAPEFKPLQPMPPPRNPDEIIIDSLYEKQENISALP